jgi:sirohydrochlorin ferrochelatase
MHTEQPPQYTQPLFPHRALLLIAHGSREAEANADLHLLAEEIRNQHRYGVVQAGFLELAHPSIEEAAHQCVAAGANEVILLPYFLSSGVHVRRDLTNMREFLTGRFPPVQFLLAEPLARHPLLQTIVAERAREAEFAGKKRCLFSP